jgi:uncharacterized protein (DUF58 family)
MSEDYTKYLDPKVINKIAKLDLKARLIVEGFLAGQHRSPYKGFSIEFAEHREYTPGDDLRHLDWKVFGKSDRYYIKQYEVETNFRAHLLVDCSESMAYRGNPEEMSKMDYAASVAAALAFLIIQQQDSVGLTLFDQELRRFVPESSSPAHLRNLLHELAQAKPGQKTQIGGMMHQVAEKIKRRGLVILISDLLDKPEDILLGLQHLRHKQHEVIVFQILDKDEVTFPFEEMTRFEGLEAYPDIVTHPRALRQAYLEEVNTFLNAIKKGCRSYNIDYVQITTDQQLDIPLTAYLATRAARSRAGR